MLCCFQHTLCVNQHIYAAIASRRRRLGLSQQELASRAGLRREKVNRLESRGEDVGLDELCRLLDALGLELRVGDKREPAGAAAAGRRLESPAAGYLVPRKFREASFLDGAKARIVRWGKLPR